jgi:hypothetical protein
MVTKRQLGIALIALGLIGASALLAVDYLGGGRFVGIGPTQKLALLAAGGVIVLGLSLLPLGDKPA